MESVFNDVFHEQNVKGFVTGFLNAWNHSTSSFLFSPEESEKKGRELNKKRIEISILMKRRNERILKGGGKRRKTEKLRRLENERLFFQKKDDRKIENGKGERTEGVEKVRKRRKEVMEKMWKKDVRVILFIRHSQKTEGGMNWNGNNLLPLFFFPPDFDE